MANMPFGLSLAPRDRGEAFAAMAIFGSVGPANIGSSWPAAGSLPATSARRRSVTSLTLRVARSRCRSMSSRSVPDQPFVHESQLLGSALGPGSTASSRRPFDRLDVVVRRMRKLERLGLAKQLGAARWYLSERTEPMLRALGERNDIIKRIHKGLAEQAIERSVSDYVLDGDPAKPVIGRLIARGLDDELRGTAYAVIDGTDGRTHHLRLPDLDATSAPSTRRFVLPAWMARCTGCGTPSR
jgi:hypothetical protein